MTERKREVDAVIDKMLAYLHGDGKLIKKLTADEVDFIHFLIARGAKATHRIGWHEGRSNEIRYADEE